MNKLKIILGAIALAIVAAMIVACTKEKENRVAQNNGELTTVSKEDDMSAYLKQFKEKMQSAAKGDETLSIEDARWHLESVLNYTYGDAGHIISDIQCDTFYYTLHASGDEVTLARLNEAFITLSKDVENAYADCNLPEKSILAIQTVFENKSKDDDIVVQTILSIRGFSTIPMWFDSTDYWSENYFNDGCGYVDAGGKCGPFEGDCPNSGAPLELTKKLNIRIPVNMCATGGLFYTDISGGILSVYSNDFDSSILDDENSPCLHKLYYRNEDPSEPWASNPGGCICPDDMNYYLSKGPELLNYCVPQGMYIIYAYYQSNEILSARASNCFHELVLQYGRVHCNGAGGGNDY